MIIRSSSNSLAFTPKIAYSFGKNGGSIVFNYEENNYPDTKLDSIELSFMTYTFNCTLVHISSAVSTDHITIRLDNGVPIASYNLGYRTHQIAFRKPIQVNDGNYHKLRFNRFGQNSTLQLDSNWTVNLHPKSRSGARLYTVFNSHSHIRLGGVDNQQQLLLNYDAADDYDGNYDEPNQRPDSPDEPDERLEESALLDKEDLRTKNNNYASNQIVNSLSARPIANAHSPDHFVGIMMNVLVNGFSMLDMAADDNPNVILSGDVHLLLSLPKSSAHHHRSPGHHKAVDQLSSHESNYIKQQRDLNHFHLNHHRKAPPPLNKQHKDLLEMMQGDQPAYAERSRQANKLVRVNNDHPNEKRDKSSQNSANSPNNQNYEGDDLIFSGSGCFDDEDECANYADAGSGYDDLITPVYVPIKPKPNSKAKTSSNKSKPNKPNQRQRPKCTPPAHETDPAVNRVPRTEDDEEDDTDDDECEFEGSGAGEAEGSSNSEETTERTSVDNQNGGELYPYQLSTTEQSNVINRVTVDDDDRSILFTSQPIPPPASELEKIIESTTRRPLPPKRPGGHIEIVMLPLPSETATPKSSLIHRGLNNKENRKMSGIQITGLSPNDINLEDLDASFDDGIGGQDIGYGRDPSLSETGGSDILGGAIHINRNLIDFKFNKNSADRTALLIAMIAILIIIIVIIAPIVVFVKMRLRISRNGKLGVPITAQMSPAYQATNKSYASLAASGSMMNPLGAPLGACNPAAFASNPNFHSNMGIMPPNLTLTANPVYGTIDSKAPKLPNKKECIGKEWYV